MPLDFSTSPWTFSVGFELGVSKSCTVSEIILELLRHKLVTYVGHTINAKSTTCWRTERCAPALQAWFIHSSCIHSHMVLHLIIIMRSSKKEVYSLWNSVEKLDFNEMSL